MKYLYEWKYVSFTLELVDVYKFLYEWKIITFTMNSFIVVL